MIAGHYIAIRDAILNKMFDVLCERNVQGTCIGRFPGSDEDVSFVHLKEMSTYLVIIQIEQVHFLFSIYSVPKEKITFCVNCVNIYKLLLRGSVFRVNIYCILHQEPLQKTLCESILFIFSPYCTRCSLMRIKLSCLVLSCL